MVLWNVPRFAVGPVIKERQNSVHLQKIRVLPVPGEKCMVRTLQLLVLLLERSQ